MRCRLHRFSLTKAVPLAISRGTTAAVEHWRLEIAHEGIVGLGETGGFDTGHRRYEGGAVAAELEWLRCSARLTQAEVARRMGVSQSTVSRVQATPVAELRLGEILSFLRAVGAGSASLELTTGPGRRPTTRLSVPGRGGR